MASSTTRDGLRIAYEERGEPGLVFVHANGFCKEVWGPVIDAVGRPGHVAIDQPAHGASSVPPRPFDWWDFGRNVLAVIDAVGAVGPVGVGHSSGGAALVMAEVLRPGTFRRLVLIEPILPPPPYRRSDDHPLVRVAMRRRAAFVTRDAAYDAYAGRGPFARWDQQALAAYVDHGFRAGPAGWELRCSPADEAEVYATATVHAAWDRLPEIACPTVIVAGSESDSHPPAVVDALVARFQHATGWTVEGGSHLVPMEDPAAMAAVISAG